MEEVWKPVIYIKTSGENIDYTGIYEVNNYGKIRKVSNKHKLPQRLSKNGYYIVNLTKDKSTKTLLVHRIVAIAFIPNPNNLPCVNHKDENRRNNFVWVNEDGTVDLEKSNLEWCTNLYNHNYGTVNERISNSLKKCVISYLDDSDYYKEWPSAIEAAEYFNVSRNAIYNVIAGKAKTSCGFKWRYK